MPLGIAIAPYTTCTWKGWIGNITWATPPSSAQHKHLTRAETMYPKVAADCIRTPGATAIPLLGRDTPLQLTRTCSVPCHYNLLGHEVSLAITNY